MLGQETTDLDVISEGEPKVQLYETDEAHCILNLVQEFDRQEEFVRISSVREWKKQLFYWDGIQYLAWDALGGDWKTPEQVIEEDPDADIDPALYAKVVNVYKAHGEIMIGALSSALPAVRFFPKDADDPDDVTAAKARSHISKLIQKQNRARLLVMRALFLLYTQGMTACYNENKSDYRFGSIKSPEYADVQVVNRDLYCPGCGQQMGSQQFPLDQLDAMDAMGDGMGEAQTCPNCGPVSPEPVDSLETQKQQIGETVKPKNRECLEMYGPLNVKFPMWARDQESIPYLILETEEHVSLLREIYPEIAERIEATSYPDTYDKESRIPTAYKNDFPRDLATVQRVWLRPWAFNSYGGVTSGFDREKVLALKSKYPEGVYAVIINHSLVAEIVADKLDDHWTISENPLADTLHPKSIGYPMVPIADITNELTNLTLETIEFGLPEVYADPHVLDFDAYRRNEARPGQVSPATMPSGQGLSSGFHEVKAASLSREVELFADRMTSVAQFVMGSYPSIYGGSQDGGSGTAREYEISRTQALQRLSTTWTILQEFYAKVMGKSVQSFIKNMQEDERLVEGKGTNFINVWIRQADLQGEVMELEPEVSDAFPISWAQKRDVILNLIQLKDPDIAMVIRHPENASLIASIIGVPELYIPGDDDRNKQLYEIGQLILAEPMEIGGGVDESGQPIGQEMKSTVEVIPELDNHLVESEICKAWLKSEVGLVSKQMNPGGWMNVLTHMKEHLFFAQMMVDQQREDDKDSEDVEDIGGEK